MPAALIEDFFLSIFSPAVVTWREHVSENWTQERNLVQILARVELLRETNNTRMQTFAGPVTRM